MNDYLFNREIRICNEKRELIDEIQRGLSHLDLSVYRQIIASNKGPINQLDIDVSENRYLISVSGDGIIQIYDLYENLLGIKKNENKNENENKIEYQPILKVNRNNTNIDGSSGGNKSLLKGLSCVQWYPIDTGLFFTGGVDGYVEVWDTNQGQVSNAFNLENCVNSISYSQINTTNLLIAAATSDQKIRLCDMRTNSSVHCLTGHRESVLSVKWSPFNPHLIASGSKDKTIRLWDIRRGDTFLLAFDQYNGSGSGMADGSTSGSSGDIGTGDTTTDKSKQSKRYRQKLHAPKSIHSSKSSTMEKFNGSDGGNNVGAYYTNGGSANLSLKKEVPTAHNGTITSMVWTHDGNYLISTGADSKIRCWNIEKGYNTMINYPQSHNVYKIPNQISIDATGKYLFHPNGRSIHCYEISTGKLIRQLKGHFEKINCCIYYNSDQSLLSGSNDKSILYWDNSVDDQLENQQFIKEQKLNENNNQTTTTTTSSTLTSNTTPSSTTTTTLEDVDNWSDDD